MPDSRKKTYQELEQELAAAKEQNFSNERIIMQHTLASVAMNIGLWDMNVASEDLADPDNRFIWSPEFRQLLGFSDESDFPNLLHSWSSRLHPEDHDRTVAAFTAHMCDRTGKTPYDIEYRLKTKSGEYRHFHALGTALRDNNGVPLRAAGAIKDITENKRYQEAVQNTLLESNMAIDAITTVLNQSGAMIYMADPETDRIMFMTNALKEHVGFADEVIGRTCYELFHGGRTQRCGSCRWHQHEMKPGTVLVTEERNRVTNAYYRMIDRIIEWPGDRNVRIMYITDLTSMKNAQETLEQRERLLGAFNQMKTILLSQEGIDFDEMLGDSLKPIAEAFSLDRIDVYSLVASNGEERLGQIYRWNRSQGRLAHLDENLKVVPHLPFIDNWIGQLEQGKNINVHADVVTRDEYAFLNAIDIKSMLVAPVIINDGLWGAVVFQDHESVRFFDDDSVGFLGSVASLCADAIIKNQIKNELASAEERVRLMMNASPISCQLLNSSFEKIDCNTETLRLFGFSDKQEYMERYPELYPEYQPDGQRSTEKVMKYYKKTAEEGWSRFDWTYRMPDGSLMPTEAVLVKVAHGDDFAIAGYVRDLREHNRMMDQLNIQKEELALQSTTLQTIIDSIPDLIFSKDRDSRYTLLNLAGREFLKADANLVGRNVDEIGFPEDLKETMIAGDREIFESGQKLVTEDWLTSFDGTRRYFETTKAPIRQGDDVVGLVGVSRDVTESHGRDLEIQRAHEENALQLAKLNLVLKGAKIGLWDVDYVNSDFTHPTNIFNWSDGFKRMLEITDEDDFESIYASQDERIHPEDRDRAVEAFERHLADRSGRTVYDVEMRMLKKSGEYGYFRETCETLRDEDGFPVRSAGALMDITESKELTNALNFAVLESRKTIDIMSTILNSTDAMIYVSDKDTNELLFINEYMKEHFGIGEDIAGQSCFQVLQGGDRQCAWCPRAALDMSPGQFITQEQHNPRTNRFYRSTARYIDWPGGVKAYVQHSVDLTDIRQMQDELNDSQRKLHTINSAAFHLLNSDIDTFEGILHQSMLSLAEILDVDRITIWKNFISEDELYTSQVFDWAENVPSIYEEGFTVNVHFREKMPAWFDTLSGGSIVNSLVRDVSPKERSNLLHLGVKSILVLPIFVEDQFWGFVGFDNCRDERLFTKREESILWSASVLFVHAWIRNEILASLRDTSSQLESALNAAQQANRSKDNFLRTVSHEIRTPMNVILGLTEIQLQSEDLDESGRQAFQRIHASGDMLLGIINDILDMSKMEVGKLTVVPETYELASLISDTLQTNLIHAGSDPIEFHLDVDENLPTFLWGDALRIKQILNNLLSNAFKYTAEGQVSLLCYTEPGPDEKTVSLVFEVSDTGQGMTKEQLGKIFDMYARFNLETNQTIAGTGLGMSILKNLLDMMNGAIEMESEPGVGSKFTVRIPQSLVSEEVLGTELVKKLQQFELYGGSQLKRVLITREPMPYGRVLIVDDVEANIFVARGLMLPYDLKIDTALSGFAAIEKIENGHVYDIIFMDHMMPRMDGMEAMKILKEKGYTGSIVALTANAVLGQAEIFIQNGFDDFLSKPLDLRQLNSVLNRFIRDRYLAESPGVVEAARQQAAAAKNQKAELKMPIMDATLNVAAIQAFMRDATKAISVLEQINKKPVPWSDEDKKMYEVHVHGMKSALAIIGKPQLSGIAARLEKADYDVDVARLQEKTASFIDSLGKVVRDLERNVRMHSGETENEDSSFLRERLLAIRAACPNYDVKTMAEAIRQLKGKPWSGQTLDLVTEIARHLLHSDFNAIVAVIDEYLDAG